MPASDAPDGVVAMTKIDDANGCRNECTLKRGGNLWWTPDGGMYVYYRPTHFRRLTADEREVEVKKVRRAASAVERVADEMKF